MSLPGYFMQMTSIVNMEVKDWLRSQRLIIVLATLYMIGAVVYAISGFWGVDEMPPGAAVAFLGIAAIGVAGFIVSLPAAWAFRRGGIAKTVAAVVIVGAGAFVYYTSGFFLIGSSGFFIGFLPLFLIATGIGGLVLYEEHGSK